MGRQRRQVWWGCARKRRYPTRRAALNVIRRMHEQGLDPARVLIAYACQRCDGWHVGHDYHAKENDATGYVCDLCGGTFEKTYRQTIGTRLCLRCTHKLKDSGQRNFPVDNDVEQVYNG